MTEISNRRQLLNDAADLIDGDRNVQYGDPIDDFRRTAAYWSLHIGGVLHRKLNNYYGSDQLPEEVLEVVGFVEGLLDPHDVAIMMTLLKNSRLTWSPEKQDHWADGAGYYGCGWDCVVREHA